MFTCTQRGCAIKTKGKKHPAVCPICNNPQNVEDDGKVEMPGADDDMQQEPSGDALTGAGDAPASD